MLSVLKERILFLWVRIPQKKPASPPQDPTGNPILPLRIPLIHLSVRIFLESSHSLSEFHGNNLLSVRIPSESFSVEFMLGIKTLNVSFPLPLSHRVRYILLKSVNL